MIPHGYHTPLMISEDETETLTEEKASIYSLKTENRDLKVQTSIFAFPNPSRDFTTIEYSLVSNDLVTIEIYDKNGNLLTTLMNNKQHKEGIYQVDFDTSSLPSGQYNCILKTSSILKNCKIIKTN